MISVGVQGTLSLQGHPSLTHAVRTGKEIRKERLSPDFGFRKAVEEIEAGADVDANCCEDQLEFDAA